jgi:hypothetical protein
VSSSGWGSDYRHLSRYMRTVRPTAYPVRVLMFNGDSHTYSTARVVGVIGDCATIKYLADWGWQMAFLMGVRRIWQGRV